jgi:hypothetical protein
MPFSKPTHWVELRADAERSLRRYAPDTWNKIGSEIQVSCEHFRANCPDGPVRADWKPENGHRIIVTITASGRQRTDVVFTFRPDTPEVDVTVGSQPTMHFALSWDGNSVFLFQPPNADRMTAEDLCRHILEPLFFANTPQ